MGDYTTLATFGLGLTTIWRSGTFCKDLRLFLWHYVEELGERSRGLCCSQEA